MYKINGMLYISDSELKYLMKNNKNKISSLQKKYGELRRMEDYMRTTIPNRPNRYARRHNKEIG